MSKRADDLLMLEEVLDDDELSDDEREIFESMLESLNETTTRILSEKQRNMLLKVHDRSHPAYANLYSSGKVPEGNPVPTPPVLQNLPKFPPGRKPKSV
jgi:hypothetical protein